MAKRIVVFGATGFTGGLIVERLAAAGVRPVLAGRSRDRLAAIADRLGGLEVVRADAMRANTVFSAAEGADVLVSTVGPFMKWGLPAVRAAVAAGCTYIDTTGEPEFIRRVFEEFGPPASRSGATLLPALGYDFAPGVIAGALALSEGVDARRVDVGYYALGGGPTSLSAGTRESVVGVTLGDGHAFRDGRVVTVRPAERVRSFTVAGKSRDAISVGGSEHFALPAGFPELREVNVYLGWFGPLARPMQAGSFAGSWVRRVPGVQPVMRIAGERAVGLLGSEPGGTRSWVVAEAFDAADRRVASVDLVGADGYDFTASFVAWAAQQDVSGTGALGPVQAYGLEACERGAAQAGLQRLP